MGYKNNSGNTGSYVKADGFLNISIPSVNAAGEDDPLKTKTGAPLRYSNGADSDDAFLLEAGVKHLEETGEFLVIENVTITVWIQPPSDPDKNKGRTIGAAVVKS